MNALGQTERPAGALALPVLLTALMAALALAPGCIIIDNHGDGDWQGDCINPWDDSCFNCPDGCDEIPDADGDGLGDDSEGACNLDPNNADTDLDGVLDGDEDLDGDGFSTAEELAFGSDCADGTDHPGEVAEGEGEGEGEGEPPPADFDGDGMSDADEATRGTDPANPDTDGDGQCDGAEVSCGSSPLDPVFTCT